MELLNKEVAAGVTVKLEVTLDGVLDVAVKCDVIAQLEALAAKTDNTLDDKVVGIVKRALGR